MKVDHFEFASFDQIKRNRITLSFISRLTLCIESLIFLNNNNIFKYSKCNQLSLVLGGLIMLIVIIIDSF